MPDPEDDAATLRRDPATEPDVGAASTEHGPATIGSVAPAATPGPITPLAIAADGARYTLGEMLGQGGMGEVRLAHDTRVDREVAVKLMRRGAARSPDATMRFLREARVQGRLDHPAVVPVHDLGVDERGAPYFAMKRLTGTTLADVLAAVATDVDARARWPRRLLLDRLVDVCLAVEFAHARGVVHRDLKPANLMLGDYGEAYVLDWGIARVAGDRGAGIRKQDLGSLDEPAGAGHTAAGALLGTPGYMAPEQIRGVAIDGRADVYALGCILFEILTLHAALPRGPDAFEATLDASPHRPRLRYPDAEVPPELDDACGRATAPRADDRLASARDLAVAIRAYLDGDRDLARRRALAHAHAEAGARALAAGDGGRAEAMREAGRAISLDPTCRPAQDLLSHLLLEPPATPLPEVLRSIDAERHRAARVQIRAGGRTYLGYLLFLPFLAALGVKSWLALIALAVPILVNWLLCEWAARRDRPVGNLFYVALVIHGATLAMTGLIAGPLVVLPLLAIGSVAVFVNVPTLYRPTFVVLVHLAAFVAPLLLEWSGVTPRTYYIADGLVLRPWAIDLNPGAYPLLIVVLVCAQLAAPAFIAARLRRVQDSAQEQLHLHHWHLRQLIPEQPASGAPR